MCLQHLKTYMEPQRGSFFIFQSTPTSRGRRARRRRRRGEEKVEGGIAGLPSYHMCIYINTGWWFQTFF